jgi:ribosome-associated heat shock protein Hsp15
VCYRNAVTERTTTPPPAAASVRLDRWLWAARFFKSRSLAAAACVGGKVDVNEQAAKPARALRVGDLLHVTRGERRHVARVRALGERRGSAADAALLYEDLTPPAPPRAVRPMTAYRPPGAGRPTKRERRLLDRLAGR